MLEGKIAELRHHTLLDGEKMYHRFLAIVLDVEKGHNRTFDDSGKEIETEQSRATRSRVGYSSWKEDVVKDPNELTLAQISKRLGEVGFPPSLKEEGKDKLHPNVPNRYEFWADRQLVTSSKLAVGETVRIKCFGSSNFVESVWRTDATPLTKGTGYAGEDVDGGWTKKVMAQKQHVKEPEKPAQDENKDGVDDDEWD